MNSGAGYKIIALHSDNTLRPCIMHKRIIGKVYTLEDYKREQQEVEYTNINELELILKTQFKVENVFKKHIEFKKEGLKVE